MLLIVTLDAGVIKKQCDPSITALLYDTQGSKNVQRTFIFKQLSK